MRRVWRFVLIGLAIALVAGLVGWRISARFAARTGRQTWATGMARYAPISVSLDGTGALQPGRVEDVRLAVGGQVRRVHVATGDTVTAGRLLLELANEAAYLAWEQARLTYEVEAERLEQMIAGDTGGVSATALRAAELRVEQARLTLRSREQAVADLTVRAQMSGRVEAVVVAKGDTVVPGSLLFAVQEGSAARVGLQVPEDRIGSLAVGDQASVILGPLPEVHVVGLSLGETSVYGLRLGDPVVAAIEGQWVSTYSPIVRGTVAEIRGGGAFFQVTVRLPGLPESIPAGANVGFMQIYPSGPQAQGTVITASGKLALATDTWGLEERHLIETALSGRVTAIGSQGSAAGGVVSYPVTVELAEHPPTARAGMSAHAAIVPAAADPVFGLTVLQFAQGRVTAATAGTVVGVLVSDGQLIEPGQVLVELDNENARLQLEMALNDLAVQENQLREMSRPQYSERELRNQEIRVRQAELTMEAREADVRSLRVYAPQDGIIANWHSTVEPGREVPAGLQVCRVLNHEVMLLVVQIDELQLDQLEAGMPAEVTVDALPGQAFAAHIAEISPEGQYQQGISRFAVTVAIEASPRLRSQMTATATIFVAEKERALLVPAEGVTFFRDGEGEVTVLAEDGRTEVRRIAIGLFNNTHVEVISGLAEDEKVITGVITVPGLPNWRNPGSVRIP